MFHCIIIFESFATLIKMRVYKIVRENHEFLKIIHFGCISLENNKNKLIMCIH